MGGTNLLALRFGSLHVVVCSVVGADEAPLAPVPAHVQVLPALLPLLHVQLVCRQNERGYQPGRTSGGHLRCGSAEHQTQPKPAHRAPLGSFPSMSATINGLEGSLVGIPHPRGCRAPPHDTLAADTHGRMEFVIRCAGIMAAYPVGHRAVHTRCPLVSAPPRCTSSSAAHSCR